MLYFPAYVKVDNSDQKVFLIPLPYIQYPVDPAETV